MDIKKIKNMLFRWYSFQAFFVVSMVLAGLSLIIALMKGMGILFPILFVVFIFYVTAGSYIDMY